MASFLDKASRLQQAYGILPMLPYEVYEQNEDHLPYLALFQGLADEPYLCIHLLLYEVCLCRYEG